MQASHWSIVRMVLILLILEYGFGAVGAAEEPAAVAVLILLILEYGFGVMKKNNLIAGLVMS